MNTTARTAPDVRTRGEVRSARDVRGRARAGKKAFSDELAPCVGGPHTACRRRVELDEGVGSGHQVCE